LSCLVCLFLYRWATSDDEERGERRRKFTAEGNPRISETRILKKCDQKKQNKKSFVVLLGVSFVLQKSKKTSKKWHVSRSSVIDVEGEKGDIRDVDDRSGFAVRGTYSTRSRTKDLFITNEVL
jgi:hypothetical protein